MKLIFPIIIILLFPLLCYSSGKDKSMPADEFVNLNRVINQSEKYASEFEAKVGRKKKLLNSRETTEKERIKLLIDISALYRANMTDSALLYSSLAENAARRCGDEREKLLTSLSMADALASAGFFSDALLKYDSLRVDGRDRDAKISYYQAGRRIYSNLANYAAGQGMYSEHYIDKYSECDDSLISLLPKDDLMYTFIINERLVNKGKYEQARKGLEELLSKLQPSENLYGMTAFQLAKVYRTFGDNRQYAAYLAKAAESDVRSGVREGFALPALAAWLYDQGKFDDAFRYINFALEEANRGDARVRMVSMAGWVPLIDEAYRREINASRNELILYVVLVSLLLLALGVLVVFLLREVRKSRKAHMALLSESKLKDTYIGNFIGLCSTYSEQYGSLVKLVDRKISSGQSSELLKMLKNGKIAETGSDDFYKTIDSVILDLYPDFIDRVNGLLRSEEQISLSSKNRELNPELRIYAFVKLGVTESTKIARILNYSVNTVYTYRNRMRNRAIDRDTFEYDIKNI